MEGAFLRGAFQIQWVRGLLAGMMFSWLQVEDDLCNFTLCQEVPFEQDSTE
jgi:hypothetical protein